MIGKGYSNRGREQMRYFDFRDTTGEFKAVREIVDDYTAQFDMLKDSFPDSLTDGEKYQCFLLMIQLHVTGCLLDPDLGEPDEPWKGSS